VAPGSSDCARRGNRNERRRPFPTRTEVGGDPDGWGPPVSGSGRYRLGAAAAARLGRCWAVRERGAAAAARLGRCWAVRERGEGRGAGRWAESRPRWGFSPFFSFFFYLSCSKTKQNKHKQINKIKQKLCCSMNANSNMFLPYI